ncbi:MAG: extracellular solute-binding protein [Planctomycetes bacterium]|nr:extracellular solute-binding protein [Planctomycetota bacterium]
MFYRIAGIVLAIAVFVAVLKFVGLEDDGVGVQDVVVCYSALDDEFSRPIIEQFEKETGIRVDFVTDTESTKTIGLVNRIKTEHEQGRARCDVFWNNEIMNTVRLKELGALDKYEPKAAANFPAAFRDPDGTWTGFAARARVLIVNTDLLKKDEMPKTLFDLNKPQWKGKIGIAKPLFGSTATWITSLYCEEGQPRLKLIGSMAKDGFFRVLGGNKATAQAVGNGTLAMAFTDTDDAIGEKESGKPVELVYLDGGKDDMGDLFFPNTLSVVKGCPNPGNAKKLIEYLLSEKVEIALATGASAQIPVNPAIDIKLRIATPRTVKPMNADWDKVAANFDEAKKWIEKTFGP